MDAIINDTPVKDLSHKLPAVGEKKLPTPPPEIVNAVFRKMTLPSPPVDDYFKLSKTKKDDSDVEGKKYTDNSSESCSDEESDKESIDNSPDDQETDSESDENSSGGSTTEDKESINNSSADDDDDDENDDADEEEDVEQPVIKYKFLPKTVKGLEKRFNTRFVEFTRQGKHENRNELVALLDEMLRRKAIERDEYKRLNDLVASSLPSTGEEKSKKSTELTSIDGLTDTFIDLYKRFECDGKKQQNIDILNMLNDLKSRDGISKQSYDILKKRIDWIGNNPIPIVKCVTNEIIESDVNELHKILTGIKVDDERVDRLEKLLSAGDYIDDQPSVPIVLRAIDDLDDKIPK